MAGDPKYSQYYAVEAEGHRIGLMSCRRCGALVLLGDADFDAAKAHDAWHVQRPSWAEGLVPPGDPEPAR